MTTYVLAIDSGSQSTKVSIIDDHGRVHATGQVQLQPYALGPEGHAVHPGDDLWDALRAAAREALAGFDGDPADLVAVGLCGIRFCRALLDAEGRLCEPVLSWMDARVSQPLGRTGPEVATVTGAGGYLTVRLTGERRDSAASYQGTWPLDPATGRWSELRAERERTGMPLALLPDLVDPGGLLGPVTRSASAETGIPAGLPVYATANDKAVEALGCGLLDEGEALLSLGTYIAAMAVGESPGGYGEDRGAYWVNAAAVPGRFLHESRGIRRGMWTVTWLRHLVSAAAPDLVDPHAVQEWLDRRAREVPPGCGGLLTLPDWLPPGDAPHRRGTILGLDGSHGAAHLHRSVLEGIVLTMRGHLEAMEAARGRAAERMLVCGGGARSELMMQIVADALGRPVERAGVADAAGLGAAICATVGHGLHPDVASAVRAMTRPGARFVPEPAAQARYEQVYEVYRGLGELIDPALERSAPLRA